jgi:hypothetical protein
MPEFGELMAELNSLDDQILACIAKFEASMQGRLTILVEVPFQDGHLAWMKVNSAWRVVYEERGTVTAIASSNRLMRMEAVHTGFEALLKRIKPALEENIIERRKALQVFTLIEKEIDEVLK